MKKDITVDELARIFEPEAYAEDDKCKAQGIDTGFDDSIKILRAMTYARKAIKYIYHERIE